ncbi:acyl-CoA thioesterase [Peribacillus sp. NPDC096540]|uniref:acyl-CoA thioesterase n=1 Tax=Peribacillus sp. NPDC096540 TaxID=3390612 RepID=UPI003D016761
MSAVTYDFQVKWGDTDAAGIVYYPNFYSWMDEATHHFFKTLGHPTSKLFTEYQIGVPLLEAYCSFRIPLFHEDDVQIQTEAIEIRDKVFKLTHTFMRDNDVIAEGYELRAWASVAEHKPKAQSIPEDLKSKMEIGA